MPAHPAIVRYIREYAASIGIDPDVAERVSRTEALNVFDPSKPDRGGDLGSSFGPFQLHYGGIAKGMSNPGLGDEFTRATGLDARDPSTWPQQVKFALDTAKRDGWRQWMGAANNGIPRWAGIDAKNQGTGQAPTTPDMSMQGQATPGPGRLAGDSMVARDFDPTVEAAQPRGQYALRARHPQNPQVGTGGFIAEGAPNLGVDGKPIASSGDTSSPYKPDNSFWKDLLSGVGDKPLGGAINPPDAGLGAPPKSALAQGQQSGLDANTLMLKRQKLAEAMARLQTGSLWG